MMEKDLLSVKSSDLEMESEDEDGKQNKAKRNRSKFSLEQIDILKDAFGVSRSMNRERCKRLVALTGLEKRQICVWFTNRRASIALQKKMAQSQSSSSCTTQEMKPAESSTIPKELEKKITGEQEETKTVKPSSPFKGLHGQSKGLRSSTLSQIAQKFTRASAALNKSSQTAAKKAKLKYHQFPHGSRRKDRTPPRMVPLPKMPDSPFRGPPDITLPIVELNFVLTCKICNGYLYNPATVTECLHSFCKSCLAHYIQRNLHCPTCNILIHPSNPFVNIRLDSTMQDIVYKILPKVEQEEKAREKDFYLSRGLQYPPKPPREPTPPPPDPVEESDEETDYSDESEESEEEIDPPDWISIMIQYAGAPLGLSYFESIEKNFWRLPSYATVGQIRKLIIKKLDLASKKHIQIYIFVDTTLVHDNVSLDEIKSLFFTEEEEELLILQYGILPSDRNLFEELSNQPPPDDFNDNFCDDMVSENYFLDGENFDDENMIINHSRTPTPDNELNDGVNVDVKCNTKVEINNEIEKSSTQVNDAVTSHMHGNEVRDHEAEACHKAEARV